MEIIKEVMAIIERLGSKKNRVDLIKNEAKRKIMENKIKAVTKIN